MDYSILFRANLRRLKKEAGVSFSEIGQAVNRGGATVQRWGPDGLPDFNVLCGLADFFSEKLGRFVPIDEFFDRRPSQSASQK